MEVGGNLGNLQMAWVNPPLFYHPDPPSTSSNKDNISEGRSSQETNLMRSNQLHCLQFSQLIMMKVMYN